VTGTNPVSLGKFYSYKICAKRYGAPFNKVTRPSNALSNPECPMGHQTCGTGSVNKVTCAPKDHLCPINDIVITDSISNVPSGYQTAMLDQGYVVAFSNKSSNLPIVRLKLTEEQPCVNPTEYSASTSRKLYALLNQSSYNNCYTKLADAYNDPRYSKIGSIRESRLFEDNGVSYVIMNLPEYPHIDTNSYSWNLYTNSYYPWNIECDSVSGLGMEFMIEQIDKSSTIASTQYWAMYTSIVFLVIV
jgi:hypothetical protein